MVHNSLHISATLINYVLIHDFTKVGTLFIIVLTPSYYEEENNAKEKEIELLRGRKKNPCHIIYASFVSL